MERHFFELEKGYLNVDEKGLYFTGSGNWQNALASPERTAAQAPRRTFRFFFGLALMAWGATFEIFQFLSSGPANFTLMAGLLGLGLFTMYRILRHDFVTDHHIPFHKVLGMEQDGDRTTLRYVDGDGKERVHRFRAPADALTLIRSQLAADKR
jgi:hypothetical protein